MKYFLMILLLGLVLAAQLPEVSAGNTNINPANVSKTVEEINRDKRSYFGGPYAYSSPYFYGGYRSYYRPPYYRRYRSYPYYNSRRRYYH